MNTLCTAMQNKMSGASQFKMFFNDERRHHMMKGIFQLYYSDIENNVIFDTNRLWTGKLSLLLSLFPQCRIICCVRDIGWIIDSIEKMLRKNPLQTSRLFNFETGQSVYGRAELLMKFDSGLVGHSWSCLREAWFGEHASRLLIIDYKRLAQDPSAVMQYIYEAIEEPYFQHDFDNVQYDASEYDADLGMPGMHTVSGKVRYRERKPTIPPDLFAKHTDLCFWKRAELNSSGIKIFI